MLQNKFTNLKNYFHYQTIELEKGDIFNKFQSIYRETTNSYKYGLGIIEIETNEILPIGLTNEKSSYESFEYYLNQLPSLDLHNVSLLLALVSNNTLVQNNIFQFPTNYPSLFAKEILKETYGNLVFRHQLMFLLASCLPTEETDSYQLNEYCRQYNNRQNSFFNKLENLYLTDGCNLSELLKIYTPFGKKNRDDFDFGFVTQPLYKLAYQFIQSSNKYILE